MLFTINFDQTRKMKQEEAAKDNALAEASAMTETEAANLAWAKEGKFHLRCAKESFGYVWRFFLMFVDVHMANMDALFFRGLLLYLFFVYLL